MRLLESYLALRKKGSPIDYRRAGLDDRCACAIKAVRKETP